MEASQTSLISPRLTRVEWALLIALFCASFLLILLTSNDYGPTYDEPHYASAGVRYVEWWARLFRADVSVLSRGQIESFWSLNHEHPPLQKVATGFSQRWFGGKLPGLMAIRLPSALWFALAVCALYLFIRTIWGRRGALFSALAFATLPNIFAHAHFIALDMPITSWFFIAAALGAIALQRGSWGYTILAGLAFGLALLAKLNAFFLPVLLIVWGLIYYHKQWVKLLTILIIGPAVFVLGWPWLWIDFFPHLRAYLAFHFGHAAYNVWYLGKLYQYAPWHYPFVMSAVTTPTIILALALLGGIGRARKARPTAEDGGRGHARPTTEKVYLLLCLAITILPSALPSSPKYNGVRLFLPMFPFLAALAGGGFAWLQTRLVQWLKTDTPDGARPSALIAAALGAALLYPGANAVLRTHPYQLAYYNAIVGGTTGATKRGFETIYWGQVFKEAPAFLNTTPEASPLVLVIPKGVIYLLEFQQQAGVLRPEVRFTGEEAEALQADYVMFQAMQSDYTDLCWRLAKNEKPAWAVSLGETPLLLVYDRRALLAALSGSDR